MTGSKASLVAKHVVAAQSIEETSEQRSRHSRTAITFLPFISISQSFSLCRRRAIYDIALVERPENGNAWEAMMRKFSRSCWVVLYNDYAFQ
jgi:hypothetical protein